MRVSEKIVPKQFVEDFEKVVSHYRLKELGEYEDAKKAARKDIENAIVCYAEMARGLK